MLASLKTVKGIVSIRAAQAGDVEQFRDLRLFALRDSPTAFSSDYADQATHPISFWKNRLTSDEQALLIFAEYDGYLIGMSGVRIGESNKTKHSAGIWGVYTRPDWRGLRIANAMIDTCCEWAKTKDVNIVKLGVMADNKSAIGLYERCGFKVYGTEPRGLFYDGVYYDGFLMFKLLEDV